ncbi:MAG: B12-binding domain-containing radical SAM protein [Elusimicrobia bacterium]|nr:B12-binding domain-containing radical SAM protein [Elusimicrobiota bacterium]
MASPRVVLIAPPGIKTFSSIQMQTPNPPLGVAYIAGVLKAAGLPYRVIDAVGEGIAQITDYESRAGMKIQGLTREQILERIPADADIIGFSCMFSTLWPITRDLAAAVRARFPDALLVLGGEHGTAVAENVLRTSAVDLVVLGEGTETILDVVAAWRARASGGEPWGGVKGVAYLDASGAFRDNGLSPRKRAVDDIPLPDWDSIPIREYIDRHQINGANIGRSMPLLATWGCPYQCTFCSNPGMWTTAWIPRSPKLVADEMELYKKKYGVTNFDFQDLTAMIKRSWIIAFCDELIARRLGVTWQLPSGTRAEVFDREVSEKLYAAGLRLLSFAPESGSPAMLKLVRKQVDLDKMLASMRIALRAGFKLSCFLVIGFPGETKETLRETTSLVRKMALLGVHDVVVSKFVPYPGSKLFKDLQAAGRLKLDDDFFIMPMEFYTSKAPSFADGVSSRRLYLSMLWMFFNFYALSLLTRPWRLLEILTAVLTGREETRFAKWANDMVVVRRKWKRQEREAAVPAGRSAR